MNLAEKTNGVLFLFGFSFMYDIKFGGQSSSNRDK